MESISNSTAITRREARLDPVVRREEQDRDTAARR